MKKKATRPGQAITREQLNHLMDAMAFIIVRRQMRRYWAPVHSATLGSTI